MKDSNAAHLTIRSNFINLSSGLQNFNKEQGPKREEQINNILQVGKYIQNNQSAMLRSRVSIYKLPAM